MTGYATLLKEQDIIDIVSVGEITYALITQPRLVPGCLPVPLAQLPSRLRDFLAQGYSHRHHKPYAEVAGVFAWTIFTYALEHLAPTKKQTFSHALMGVAAREGLLSSWRGQKLGRGAFLVPTAREHDAAAFLDHWGVSYTREVVLRER